jgi:hypothetical protein
LIVSEGNFATNFLVKISYSHITLVEDYFTNLLKVVFWTYLVIHQNFEFFLK